MAQMDMFADCRYSVMQHHSSGVNGIHYCLNFDEAAQVARASTYRDYWCSVGVYYPRQHPLREYAESLGVDCFHHVPLFETLRQAEQEALPKG